MKSDIYIVIAGVVLLITSFFLFRNWLDYRVEYKAPMCVHQDRVSAVKESIIWQGKNGEPDAACSVRWSNNGKEHTAEWWNVGWCNDRTPIKITVNDYTCH